MTTHGCTCGGRSSGCWPKKARSRRPELETSTPTWQRICAAGDVHEGEPFGGKVGGVPVAVFRVGQTCYALHDVCSHEFARLSDGYQDEDVIECPLHQAQFDITTGKCLLEPAREDVASYPAKIEGLDVLVYI